MNTERGSYGTAQTKDSRGLSFGQSSANWEVLQEASIWDKAGIDLVGFEYCAKPRMRSGSLLRVRSIHFRRQSYALWIGRSGKPIVSIASRQRTNASVASHQPLQSIQDLLRGKRIAIRPWRGETEDSIMAGAII